MTFASSQTITRPAPPVAAQLFQGDRLPAGRRVAVISGGTIDAALLAELLGGAAT